MREFLEDIRKDIIETFSSALGKYKQEDVLCHEVIKRFDKYLARSKTNDVILHNFNISDQKLNGFLDLKMDKIVLIHEGITSLRKVIDDEDLILYVGDNISKQIIDLANTTNLSLHDEELLFVRV